MLMAFYVLTGVSLTFLFMLFKFHCLHVWSKQICLPVCLSVCVTQKQQLMAVEVPWARMAPNNVVSWVGHDTPWSNTELCNIFPLSNTSKTKHQQLKYPLFCNIIFQWLTKQYSTLIKCFMFVYQNLLKRDWLPNTTQLLPLTLTAIIRLHDFIQTRQSKCHQSM